MWHLIRLMASLGVGHKKQPASWVWSTQGARGYNRPLRIEPEEGQIAENNVESTGDKVSDVLHKHEAGSKLANETGHVLPKSRSRASDAHLEAGRGDVLARESAANKVNGGEV
jgi:hypothetical protein